MKIPVNAQLGASMAQIIDADIKTNVLDSVQISTNAIELTDEEFRSLKSLCYFLNELVIAGNNVLLHT